MLNDAHFIQIKTIFWGSFVLGLLTLFCPFIEQILRWEVYWKVVKSILNGLKSEERGFLLIIVLLIGTFFWMPIMGYAFYRYTAKKQIYTISQRLINYFLFGVGSTIYLLPAYIFFEGRSNLSAFSWGYWLLLICTTAMFICYLIVQKVQLVDELDMSKHLIDNEK